MNNNMKSISDGYIFQMYNKTLDLQSKMINLVKNGVIMTEEELKEWISMYNRRYTFSLTNNTLMSVQNNSVLLLNDPLKDNLLPPPIPCFLTSSNNKKFVIVNISNYINVNKSNLITMSDPKKLYSLMEGGYILGLVYSKYSSLSNKTAIIKVSMSIYTKLFTKVIKKIFSLSISEYICDTLDYLVGWFFLYNIMGRNNPNQQEFNKKYALDNVINPDSVVSFAERIIPENDFKNIDTFIKALADILSLDKLNTRLFLDQYILSYGTSMLLAIEYLPYLYMNMAFVNVGGFINNQHVIENLCKQDIKILLKELAKL